MNDGWRTVDLVVEVYNGLDIVKPIEWSELKKGDVFRLYEPTGELVGRYTALGDSFLDEDKLWRVNVSYKG